MKFTNPAPRDRANPGCKPGCADVATQLTALFDGEADATQMSEARAHLLSCPSCSRQWLDWTRYRDTLQSEPAPAVPPTLLWRVLIAYRVTAFARPARRRSRLPQISAAPLRGIEAPLPPRLSAHILAHTTRKSNAHVMLTPTQGAPIAAKSRFKGRSFSFGRAPLWAAPALALWILMLGRAEFNATLPVATPDSALEVALSSAEIVPEKVNSAIKNRIVTPIPVATRSLNLAAIAPVNVASAPLSAAVPVAATPRESLAVPLVARRESVEIERPAGQTEQAVARAVVPVSVPVARAFRAAPVRTSARPQIGLSRAFALVLNAGQSDIARAAPRPLSSRARTAPVAPVAPVAFAVPATQAPATRLQTPLVRPVKTAPRPSRVARVTRAASENIASSRVALAALASPISSVRTLSSARLNAAAFSDDSMRPRVAHSSVAGRRLARLMPDEDATRLRVSRPIAQAPTLREASLGNADNGPKLDELRSAVDDFRASVAGDE